MRVSRLVPSLVTVLALAASSPASAATSNDTSQFSVNAGSLAFGTAPDIPNVGGVTLDGTAQSATAQMPNWSVVDATGSGSGWNVTVQGDSGLLKSPVFAEYDTTLGAYVPSGATLGANSLALTSTGAGFTALNGTTGTAPSHQCGSGCNVDSASAVKIASAAANAGMGTYRGDGYGTGSLALSIPTTTRALGANKVFRVDLTWTLSSGP